MAPSFSGDFIKPNKPAADTFIARRAERKAAAVGRVPAHSSIAQSNPFSQVLDTESGATLFGSPKKVITVGLKDPIHLDNPRDLEYTDADYEDMANIRALAALGFRDILPDDSCERHVDTLKGADRDTLDQMTGTMSFDAYDYANISDTSLQPNPFRFIMGGIVAVNSRGHWMILEQDENGRAYWHNTDCKVQPHGDPRQVCPRLHGELIDVVNGNASESVVQSINNMFRQAMAQAGCAVPSLTPAVPICEQRPSVRSRRPVTPEPLPLLRPILKSPERNRDDVSPISDESAKHVNFNLGESVGGREYFEVSQGEEMIRNEWPTLERPRRGESLLWRQSQRFSLTEDCLQAESDHGDGVASGVSPLLSGDFTFSAPINSLTALPQLFASDQQSAHGCYGRSTLHAGTQDVRRQAKLMPSPLLPSRKDGGNTGTTLLAGSISTAPSRGSGDSSVTHSNVETSPAKSSHSFNRSSTEVLLQSYPGRLSHAKRVDSDDEDDEENEEDNIVPAHVGTLLQNRNDKLFGSKGVLYRGNLLDKPKVIKPKPSAFQLITSKLKRQASTKNKASNFLAHRLSDKIRRSESAPSPLTNPCRRWSKNSQSVEDDDASIQASEPSKQPAISVEPVEQMHILAKVEFILCMTANTYLMNQKEDHRMSADSVHRVGRAWRNHNRPQVMEFMFDLGTQLELTKLNADTFLFHGPRAHNSMSKASLLNAWKSLARDMNYRTFCAPDHALKKILVDGFRLLEMLGAHPESFIEFQNMQRSIVEASEGRTRKSGLTGDLKHGATKRHDSPLLFSSRGIVDDDDDYYDDGIYKG